MATKANITIMRANDILLAGTITDAAGVPVNITGAVIRFAVRKHLYDTGTALQVNGAVTAGPAGEYQVALTHDQTRELIGTYNFTVQLEAGGMVYTTTYGILTSVEHAGTW